MAFQKERPTANMARACENENDRIPGTVQLIDIENHNASHSAERDVILLPTPSDDPHDPLNWSPSRKTLSTICLQIFMACETLANSTYIAVLTQFSKKTGLSVATINEGTGYMFLLAGWGLIFWQPFALKYGKRLTYLLAVLGTLGCCIWSPFCTTKAEWLLNRVLAGFFVAPSEALPETSVTDVYFVHQHGRYLALYALSIVAGMYLGPVFYGYIALRADLNWVFYVPTIFNGVSFVFLFFFMEETSFSRTITTPQSLNVEKKPDGVLEHSKTDEKGSEAEPRAVDCELGTMVSQKRFISRLSLVRKDDSYRAMRNAIRIFQYLRWPLIVFCGYVILTKANVSYV